MYERSFFVNDVAHCNQVHLKALSKQWHKKAVNSRGQITIAAFVLNVTEELSSLRAASCLSLHAACHNIAVQSKNEINSGAEI